MPLVEGRARRATTHVQASGVVARSDVSGAQQPLAQGVDLSLGGDHGRMADARKFDQLGPGSAEDLSGAHRDQKA